MMQKQSANNMQTSLRRITEQAKQDKTIRFRHLYTKLNEDNLEWSLKQLNRQSSPGIDKMRWVEYLNGRKEYLKDLVERLKQKRYRARLILRRYIPKGGGKLRPLGIPVIEDKVLQYGGAKILEAIYESEFYSVNWGYRPGKGAREASRYLASALGSGRYKWVVEADIKGFFDNINHELLLKMLGLRIDDRAFLGLIRKWLKAGVLETDGKVIHPATGTPQGGVISPVLSNVYLHYVLDLWFMKKVRKAAKGPASMIRYADDFVCMFERRDEAEAFMKQLRDRLKKFGLELSEEKTRLVRFDRDNMEESETFDFLGFKYCLAVSRNGKKRVQRRTAPDKMRKSLAAFKEWINSTIGLRVATIIKRLNKKLTGYWNYYGVQGNGPSLCKFWTCLCRILYHRLNRRSQRHSYNWNGFSEMLKAFRVPGPRIVET